tara:strand:- start:120 stop:251 length:132 start_codon:yes stop_codon:yes gene_type:complete
MKANTVVIILVAMLVIALDPQWAFLISCLLLMVLLLSIGGDDG